MINKLLLICILSAFFATQLSAMDKLSVYDPLGVLSLEERNSIEAEGKTLIASRRVKGQDLLIQIDFLSKNEFDKGGVTGRDKDGKTLFSLGTYTDWSVRYSSQPAVLILFLDQENGKYVLDAVNFSDMLMDEGIPDLVRRYIRDEIMKKGGSYVETISRGLYAIGEALNPVYRARLDQKGNEMLTTDDRYQRAHCNHWSDCKYYEYYPIERLASSFPENTDFSNSFFIEAPNDYSVTAFVENAQKKILDWSYTHNSRKVSDWPWQDKGMYLKNNTNTEGFIMPVEYHSFKNNGDTLSFFDVEEEQKNNGELLPVMGYLQIHGWKATYCNFFAYDLSRHIFGHVPWGAAMRANEIHDYFQTDQDFTEISKSDISQLLNAGFIIYATINKSPNPGHIATFWSSNLDVIQAGGTTGIMNLKQAFGNDVVIFYHIYLGFLHKVS